MKFYLILILFISTFLIADTPPPGTVKAKTEDGSGTPITSTLVTGKQGLDVNIISTSGSSTVNQGTGGASPWLVNINNTPLSVTQSGAWTTGRTWTLLNTTDSVNVGNFPASFGVTQVTSPWVVSATQSGVWTTGRTWSLSSGSDSISVVQSTNPWVVSGTVTSNIGTTNGLALDSTVSNVQGSPSGGTAATKSSLSGGIYNSSAPTLTTGQQASLQLDVNGNLKITSTGGTTSVTQGTSPWVSNITQFGSSNVVTGTGTSGSGIPRVTVSNDSNILATQSGAWTTGRTWSLSSGSDSISSVQSGTWNVGLNSGANTIGKVDQGVGGASAWKVDGSAVTQPVSQATAANLNATVVQSSGANLHVDVDSAPSTSVTQGTSPWVTNVTQFGSSNVVTGTGASGSGIPRVTVSNDSNILATQSGSWTVTANAGTNLNTSALATSANQTNGTQQSKITDGTNVAAVKAASTAPAATDPALVVALSPNGSQATAVAQGSTTSGQTGTLIQGAVTTSVPAYTTAQTSPLSLTLRGALRVKPTGLDTVQLIRNDYSSTNVTTAAYVQLVASTSNEINRLWIFDSSGQDFVLATGAAASEVDQIEIPPGGWDSPVDLYIASGTRLSIKSKSATASSGILLITGLK